MRLDEAKLDELRHWAQGLRGTTDEGSRASGRAILMLIEELERLRLELRHTREQLDRVDTGSDADVRPGDTAASALHGRLQQVAQDSDDSPATPPESIDDTHPSIDGDSNTASARSWIDTLRQQK